MEFDKEQWILYGMLLALWENEASSEAYYALEFLADREESGEHEARLALIGARLMLDVLVAALDSE